MIGKAHLFKYVTAVLVVLSSVSCSQDSSSSSHQQGDTINNPQNSRGFDAEQIKRGRQLYLKNCTVCHGITVKVHLTGNNAIRTARFQHHHSMVPGTPGITRTRRWLIQSSMARFGWAGICPPGKKSSPNRKSMTSSSGSSQSGQMSSMRHGREWIRNHKKGNYVNVKMCFLKIFFMR
jgi:hypothetical protein